MVGFAKYAEQSLYASGSVNVVGIQACPPLRSESLFQLLLPRWFALRRSFDVAGLIFVPLRQPCAVLVQLRVAVLCRQVTSEEVACPMQLDMGAYPATLAWTLPLLPGVPWALGVKEDHSAYTHVRRWSHARDSIDY